MMRPPSLPNRSRPTDIHPDDAIRSTDDDAAASRLSATSLGYLEDPFVSLLYKAGPSTSKKPPLINIGTHHRTHAIDRLVNSFLDRGGRQIVSLGAGSDTRYWRLMSRSHPPDIHYTELDFPHLTSQKSQRIMRSSKLSSALSNPKISRGGAQLSSDHYQLLPTDLRSFEDLSLDSDIPTLFLAECVFCYMQPDESAAIIRWFGQTFTDCIGVVYEMCGLDDAFGKVMKRNLASRQLSLPGATFPTPQSQADRFLSPFTDTRAISLWEAREAIGMEELSRISRLEMLDEIEELRLVLSHYCIAWGSRGDVLRDVSM